MKVPQRTIRTGRRFITTEPARRRNQLSTHRLNTITPTAPIWWQLWWMISRTIPRIIRSTCRCDATWRTDTIRWNTKKVNFNGFSCSNWGANASLLTDPSSHKVIPKVERADTPNDLAEEEDDNILCSPAEHLQSIFLTDEERKQWNDVIRMNDYLTKGRRPQFWEEPFTKRVLDAIKNKNLEMKKAAKLLGVSYGTLYGRYRETYGCLKHPYRWGLQTSNSKQFLIFKIFSAVHRAVTWCLGWGRCGRETATNKTISWTSSNGTGSQW